MTLSLRAYAARRRAAGLRGGSLASVQKAIAEGRITAAALTPDGQIADPDRADADWTATTAPTGEAALTPAVYLPDDVPPLALSKARKEAAAARLAERKLAEHEGKFIELEIARRDLRAMLVELRNGLLGIPSKLRTRGVTPDEHRRIAPLVDDLIRAALEDFASGRIAGMRADGETDGFDEGEDAEGEGGEES